MENVLNKGDEKIKVDERPYRTRLSRFITKKNHIIKDPNAFKTDSLPRKLIERKESDEFYKEISIFLNYRRPNNLLIKGSSGCGKTVTLKFAVQDIKAMDVTVDVFEVNCYSKSSIEIVRTLTNKHTITTVHEGLAEFLKALDKDALIVLDEIDRSGRVAELLYYLSRPTELVPFFNKNLNLILVSNDFDWEDFLADNVRSSLQLKPIVFSPYNEIEIKNILKQRAKEGFLNDQIISENLMEQLALFVVTERKSDCRFALQVLFNAALEAEKDGSSEINQKNLDKAIQITKYSLDKQLINKLNDNQLLILLVISITQTENLDDFYKEYESMIRGNTMNVDLKKKGMVYHMLNYLQDLGLVDKKISVTKVEQYPPVRKIKLKCKCDEGIVWDELTIRGLRLLKDFDKR